MFDSCYVRVLSRTVSDFVLHVVFVFESCLVTILFGDVVRLIWFMISFVFAHERSLILFFIFDSCSIRALSRICYGGVAHLISFMLCSCCIMNWILFHSSYLIRILFVLCHEFGMAAQLALFDSYYVQTMFWTELGFVLHIWFIFCSWLFTNTVWRCNSPDLNLDIVRVFTRTVSESVLHIWFMFYSRLVTNTVGWQRCLPNHHICILIWFILCSDHDTVHSYRICVMIWFVSWHNRHTNMVWTFDMVIWFILCSLWYRWCIAMLCRYGLWIYVWFEPWSDAYTHHVWFERCMVWLYRLFGLSKTKTVLWCMTCIKVRFEWCGMYVDYAPMRCLIALRVSYTRLIVDGYCIIGSFMPILMV